MARDDRFKKVQGAGADFLETARAKAEDFLKEMARSGGDSPGRAQGAFDDLIDGGRKSTEQFVIAIRKEIRAQLGAVGLATKADLADLERRLGASRTEAAPAAGSPAAGTTASTGGPAGTTASTGGAAGTTASTAGAASPPAAKKAVARPTAAKTAARTTAAATKTTAEKTGTARKSPAKKAATKKAAGGA
jgi:polyhydroxyalkanoate synthesis regulator phasin